MKFYIAFALFLSTVTTALKTSGEDDHSTKSLRGGQGEVTGGGKAPGMKTYIVTFPYGTDPGKKAEALAKAGGGSVRHVYREVLNGAALTLPAAAAVGLGKSAGVESVEEDQEARASVPVKSWGQDRIDQCEAIGDSPDAEFTKKDARDVKVYILDTGIYAANNDFKGLIDPDENAHKAFVKGKADPLNDGNGHGTHVASTTCGNQYGVVTCGSNMLTAVQVLDRRGSGRFSDIIAGVNWVVGDCREKNPNKCVANMSLGGGGSSSLDYAVNQAVASGVVMVVAAGNSGANACNYSPARAANAITVGSTTRSETISSWSNWGSCVDIFAPGSSIKAAWKGSSTATNTISGTSMASPHIAGLAAAKVQQGIAPGEVVDSLQADVTKLGIDCRKPTTGIATIGGSLDCDAVVNSCP